MYPGLSFWRVLGWLCFAFFLWTGAAVRAQDLRGTLLVTAEDTTGGRIAGAMVTLTQEKSEGTRTARADTRCLLYTSPSPRDLSTSRMPSSA